MKSFLTIMEGFFVYYHFLFGTHIDLKQTMRKVKFKKWIPLERKIDEKGNTTHNIMPNTGCFEKVFAHDGIFHCWGVSYEEFETGPGCFSVALVETSDGLIQEVLPSNIKFLN